MTIPYINPVGIKFSNKVPIMLVFRDNSRVFYKQCSLRRWNVISGNILEYLV